MNNETFEQWFKLSKNFNAPFGTWNKNANQVFYQIIDNNLNCFSECVTNTCNTLSEQMKCISHAKPETLVSTQRECLTDGMSAALTNMQKIINTSLANIDACSGLYPQDINREQPWHEKNNKK